MSVPAQSTIASYGINWLRHQSTEEWIKENDVFIQSLRMTLSNVQENGWN